MCLMLRMLPAVSFRRESLAERRSRLLSSQRFFVPEVSAAISRTLSFAPILSGMLHCASPVVVRKLTLDPAGTSQATNSPRQSVRARTPPGFPIGAPDESTGGVQRASTR
jgi:hypothetical protein